VIDLPSAFSYGGATITGSAITVPGKGLYRCDWCVTYTAAGATGRIRALLGHNGTYVRVATGFIGDTTYIYGAGGSDLVVAAGGDSFTLGTTQITGAPLATNTGDQYTYLSVSLDQEIA
jgi:hypothetical protein